MQPLADRMLNAQSSLPDEGAVFSPDRAYRYALWRVWGPPDAPLLHVIGLNPSTADEHTDDPTIRRCIGFAKARGCGGLVMTNLFALRATDPQVLRTHGNAVGDETTRYILLCARLVFPGYTVCAWGASIPAYWKNRGERVTTELRGAQLTLWCWGKTKRGHPRHPLYLPADAQLEVWR